MEITKDQVKSFLSNMKIKELADFVKELEGEWGVKAASGGGMMMAAPAAAAEAPKVEEKTEFDVILAGFAADKKIEVIKVVRELTGLGLKEAKALVEGAPQPVKSAVSKEESASIKEKLTAVGAQIDIK
jgi:large subunit ribosomal protein L7/L12